MPHGTTHIPGQIPDRPDANPKSVPDPGAIAGGMVGGVVGLTGLVVVILDFLRRRRSRSGYPSTSPFFTIANTRRAHLGITFYTEMGATAFVDPYTITRPLKPSTPPVQTSQSAALPKNPSERRPLPIPPDSPHLTMRERREQMLGQKELLEQQLKQYRLRPPTSTIVGSADGHQSETTANETVVALRHQVDVMTQKIAVLEAELVDQSPPDYVSSYGI
ncbi:hypothetical protein PQX77_021708 [Marasmius sp. AFHP31]|nr:hypothetical protein PQX77_021708 [Marasmius sp. AFHP31]